jgi:alpha-glucosidase
VAGEQMSYLALNGRAFPMWTSEPGVGRDKSTELTQQMDAPAWRGAITGTPIIRSRLS